MAVKQPTKKAKPQATKKEIRDWWQGKARSAAGIRKNLTSNAARQRSDPAIGKMFCFWYDAKHKDTLPIWDRFPLVFPIEEYSNGFLGLNLHYLEPKNRTYIINKLLAYANNNKLDKTTRLRLSYELIATSARLSAVTRPCVKRYLYGQVRSAFVEIEAQEWDKVAQLPVAIWVKQ